MAGTIIDAIKNDDLAALKRLVDEGASLRVTSEEGLSPARLAADLGRSAICEWLALQLDPDDVFDMIALQRDDLLQQIDAAQLIDARSKDGWTTLHLGAFYGQCGAVKWLIDQGAPVDAVSGNPMRNTPLHAAIAGAQCEICVKILIDAGANVNAVAAGGIVPLHLAAARGNRVISEMLLAADANGKATMDSGQTPAQMAREREHEELAGWLEQQ